MEGEAQTLYDARDELISYLEVNFPSIVIPHDWDEFPSDSPLFGSLQNPEKKLLPESTEEWRFRQQIKSMLLQVATIPVAHWLEAFHVLSNTG
jgi:hypothetical protein